MLAVFKKEINSFLGSIIGYLAIIVFLLTTGLFIWIFPGATNLFDNGAASLASFFEFAPIVLLLLIPAITMSSFSEEFQAGTYELLATKPISTFKIAMGKYLAALTLILFAILPTLVYVLSIYQLAYPIGSIDGGAIIGSYIGLLLLGASFAAVGIFASTLTNNQVVAFVLALFLCFFCFYAFEFASNLGRFSGKLDFYLRNLGLQEHYYAISKGVLDTRDIFFFLVFIALFKFGTWLTLQQRKW